VPVEGERRTGSTTAGRASRRLSARPTAVLLYAIAVAVAAYTGFRPPNDWTATLDAVSLTEGFHRRILVGTLLRPLAVLTHDNYWLFAGFGFLVLGALLAVAGSALLRTELTSARMLVVAWLLLPTGAFFFDEVGYYDQVLYLLLVLAWWLLNRNRSVLAGIVLALSVFVHEITILTVLPVFGLLALRRLGLPRAVAVLAPAVLLDAVVLLVSPAAPGAVDRLAARLATANFRYRADALALFDRTQSQSWQLYSIVHVLVYVVPLGVLAIAVFLVLRTADGGFGGEARGRAAALSDTVVACGAIGAPVLLAFAGWDTARWEFLLLTNFVLVLWAGLTERRREFGPTQTAVLVATALLVTHVPMAFFDGLAPRSLEWPVFRTFLRQIGDGSLFRIPPV
jgi:hypothetical protein